MKKIYIDANIFLDFYRLKSIKTLLPAITGMAPNIVVTEQVVAEVLRNRVNVTRDLLREEMKQFKISKPLLPDVLTKQAVDETCSEINERLTNLEKEYKDIIKLVEDIYNKTIGHVSEGKDGVSKTLEDLFSRPLKPTSENIVRAKRRKELGNPPGKKSDPIGDELSWEQLLSIRDEESCEIWVISRDEDFYTLDISGKPAANSFLLQELGGEPKVLFFRNLTTALKKLKEEDFPGLDLPSDEALEAVRKEAEVMAEQCHHKATLIQNGRFDVYMCQKCGKQLGAYHADID